MTWVRRRHERRWGEGTSSTPSIIVGGVEAEGVDRGRLERGDWGEGSGALGKVGESPPFFLFLDQHLCCCAGSTSTGLLGGLGGQRFQVIHIGSRPRLQISGGAKCAVGAVQVNQ